MRWEAARGSDRAKRELDLEGPNLRSSFKACRHSRCEYASMDPALVVSGLLLLTWPLVFRRQLRRIRERLCEKGGDVARFERAMDRRWIRAALWVVSVAGLLLVVLGLAWS
jgi:hypothetical protein